MRLDRFIAERAHATRRDAAAWVRRGRVAVNGEVCCDPGAHVAVDASVDLDGEALLAPPDLVAFHKPVGVQCTVGDPRGRSNLQDVARDVLGAGLHPVGRLDADSEGLLLFARDGRLTQRLLHPKHGVRKVYVATVEGDIPRSLADDLAAGVPTADGVHTAELVAVSGQDVTLAVQEGKHRMVRRMLANLGLPVARLVRVQFGAVTLGDLPPGAWRVVTEPITP